MNDLRMGFKHTILQRLQSFDMCPIKPPANANTDSVSPPIVTDFSINRILGEANAQSNTKLTCYKKTPTPSHVSPTPCIAKPADILDLSKTASSAAHAFPYPSVATAGGYHALHADFLAAAAAANATKFYAHFFPHMFPAYAVSNFNLAAVNIANAPMSPYQQKRYFTPYIVNSSAAASRLTAPTAASISGAAISTSSVDMLRPKNTCPRLDCMDCLDYYKHFPHKSIPIASPSHSVSSTSALSSASAHYLKAKSSTEFLLNSATISLTSVTNLNLTTAKAAKHNQSVKSTTNAINAALNSEEISYKCRICDKVFGCSQTLQAHEKTHKSPRYECTDCGKGFSQLRNYKYHLSVHRGTKEFAAECPECGKTFNDKGYLSSHMKIHRNKKEYECPYCPKSFNQRVAFNMHVRIHTGVKPHKCVECGKRFSRKMLLKQHMRTHSGEKPYQCSVCGKSFADRSNMTLHHRLHSGIKPFNCPICPKAFTKKHHLKTHLNYHTGCKPYVCPHPNCNQAFTQSSNMRTHAKKCQYRPLQLSFPVAVTAASTMANTAAQTPAIAAAAAASNSLATTSIPGRIPMPTALSAGIRMLTAASMPQQEQPPLQQQQQQQHAPFPPAQQPLLSTLRPF